MQYLPSLLSASMQITVKPLLSDSMLQSRYNKGSYSLWQLMRAYGGRCWALLWRRRFEVIWIEKEAFPWMPLWMERALLGSGPYVLYFDDAVFHVYDQHPHRYVRRFYGRRLDQLMANAALVVSGNQYLAQRARHAGAKRVVVVPTVIDIDRYPLTSLESRGSLASDGLPRIVWIGSPSTVSYLRGLQGPLQTLARSVPFVLRVIGGGNIEMPGVRVESIRWSEDTEAQEIAACDVGVMPLVDSAWERGKCGYKLIQYMACGLPVVASNVGVNVEIVRHGVNGMLINSEQEWVAALGTLLGDQLLRARMGMEGRRRVEIDYCVQRTGPLMVELLRSVAAET